LQIITTFRNLALFHRPNWYKGFKRISKLDEIRVNRFDGEIIHPGELERLNKIRQHKQRISNKLNAYQEIHDKWSQSFEVRTWTLSKKSEDNIPNIGDSLPELPCVQCGQLTTDYWSTFTDESGRKLCHCRECLDRDT